MLLVAASVACGNTSQPAAKNKIILVENAWPASALNVQIAKILLTEQLNYPVEVIALDETAQWTALAAGNAHASLEVWPSGHADNIKNYITDAKTVVDGGPLGPVGEIGWFVPSYVVAQNPALASWEGYKDPAVGEQFATAETGKLGQFLAGDPSWTQYDAQIIANLGLPFQVVTAGSEEALLAAVSAAYSRQRPILFYFYRPHAIFARYDLTQVALPPYSDACYAGTELGDPSGVNCAYPDDQLLKIFWAGLESYAPEAYTLLKNMNYSTEDQIALIADVELNGKTTEQAARDWLAAHETQWRAWLPGE